jgi:hypothetical protein
MLYASNIQTAVKASAALQMDKFKKTNVVQVSFTDVIFLPFFDGIGNAWYVLLHFNVIQKAIMLIYFV